MLDTMEPHTENQDIQKTIAYWLLIAYKAIAIPLFSIVFAIGLAAEIEMPSERQKKIAAEYNMEGTNFIRYACKSKSACERYAESRLACAAAGNIDQCIYIKMQGEEYGSCDVDGRINGIADKDTPSLFQCSASKLVQRLEK